MPRELRNHPNLQRVFRIGPRPAVLNEELFTFERSDCLYENIVEPFRRDGLIDRSPIYRGFREFIANDEFVFGRAAGELPGPNDECTVIGKQPFPALNGMLDQLLGAEIVTSIGKVPSVAVFSRHLLLS